MASIETAHFLLLYTEQDGNLMDSYAAELEGSLYTRGRPAKEES